MCLISIRKFLYAKSVLTDETFYVITYEAQVMTQNECTRFPSASLDLFLLSYDVIITDIAI